MSDCSQGTISSCSLAECSCLVERAVFPDDTSSVRGSRNRLDTEVVADADTIVYLLRGLLEPVKASKVEMFVSRIDVGKKEFWFGAARTTHRAKRAV